MLRLAFTGFLCVLNILWISLFWYIRTHTVTEPTTSFALRAHVLDWQTIDVTFSDHRSPLRFEKTSSGWQLMQPFQWEANILMLDQLQQLLSQASIPLDNKTSPAINLAAYGLDAPFCSLHYTTPSHSGELIVGQQQFKNVYVFDSALNQIATVQPEILELLQKSPMEWGSPLLFPFQDLKNIIVETPASTITLTKSNTEWRLNASYSILLNFHRTEAVVQQLMQSEIAKIINGQDVQKFLPDVMDHPRAYQLTLSDGERTASLRLFPIQEQPHAYIAQRNHSGPFFYFQNEAIDALINAHRTLVNSTICHLDLTQLKRLHYKRGSDTITVQPMGDNGYEGLHYQQDTLVQTQTVSTQKLQKLIEALNGLHVEGVLTTPFEEAECQQIVIDWTSQNETQALSLFVGNHRDAYAKWDTQPTIFKLANWDACIFQLTFDSLLDKTIWQWVDTEEILELWLHSTDNPHAQKLDPGSNGVTLFRCLKAEKLLKEHLTHFLRLPSSRVYTLVIKTQDASRTLRTYELQVMGNTTNEELIGHYLDKNFIFTNEWTRMLRRLIYQVPYHK